MEGVDETVDTVENRFVAATAASLIRLLAACGADPDVPDAVADAARSAADECTDWFTSGPWPTMRGGLFPGQSFLVRDHPHYQSIARLHRLVSALPGVLLEFPPVEKAFRLSPLSLNLLYERWVAVLVLEWVEARLGALTRPAVPSRGRFTWTTKKGEVIVRIDEPYRRHREGVFCPAGKNTPDVAVELHRVRRPIVLAVVDATYSRRSELHEAKFGYARNLLDGGSRSPLSGRPVPCVYWSAVAYPGPTLDVSERCANLAEALLSLPPGDEAEQLLRAWLDACLGDELRTLQ